VQRRPGGYDEFDALAMYLWGAIGDGSEGHTGYQDEQDRYRSPQDALYRNDGVRLPVGQRRELRSRIRGIFAGRQVRGMSPEAARGGPHDYPVQDGRLEGALHDSVYRPAHDWMGDQRRIRDNRRTRQRRNVKRYQPDRWKSLRSQEAAHNLPNEAARIARGMVSGSDPEALSTPAPKPKRPPKVAAVKVPSHPPKPRRSPPKPTPKPTPKPSTSPRPTPQPTVQPAPPPPPTVKPTPPPPEPTPEDDDEDLSMGGDDFEDDFSDF
jgi:hypothetical protein